MANVIWAPQPKQALFMSCPEFEALYGGAAGGGKSDTLVMEATRQIDNPAYQGLVMRKTYPELTELINRSIELYPLIFPKAKFNDSKHVWSFPSGAKIYFGGLNNKKDKEKYRGKQFQYIGVDEATLFLREEVELLRSRCRARGEKQRCYFRLASNPGGPGHGWVKDRYIANGPNRRINEVVEVDGKLYLRDRIYIPATVFDNRKLLENDPNYVATLAALSEGERNAFLYGDWDSFNGQVFCEWKNRPDHYKDRKGTHVIEPFRIPDNWPIYRGFDFGYSKPFSVGWYAVDHDKRIYRIAEYYGCTGTPDVGIKLEPMAIAKEIKRIEKEHPNLQGRRIRGIADPSIYDCSRGESVGAMMEREGVYFEKGDNERIAGKMQFHYRLAFDENDIPMFYVFNTCRHFIRCIPNLVYDETHVEDINTKQEDHNYDECRYVFMANLLGARVNKQPVKHPYNPLGEWDNNNKLGKYDFYIH